MVAGTLTFGIVVAFIECLANFFPAIRDLSTKYTVMQQAQSQGKDFYQTMILASIVEREAIHDSDKPLVAGVYQGPVARLR